MTEETKKPVRLIPMEELMFLLGNISRDSVDRKFKAGRMRKIKQGQYTYARSDDVEAEIERLTQEAETLASHHGQAA